MDWGVGTPNEDAGVSLPGDGTGSGEGPRGSGVRMGCRLCEEGGRIMRWLLTGRDPGETGGGRARLSFSDANDARDRIELPFRPL